MDQRRAGAGAVAALITLVGLTWAAVHTSTSQAALWIVLAMWGDFALGAILVMRASPRLAVGVVVGGAVALQGAALAAPPHLSTDAYRYAWDGRVQAAGVNPYLHAPIDEELRELRDPFLFPGMTCDETAGDCTLINRPSAHTIYPPTAQLYFRLVHSVRVAASPQPGTVALQLAAALVALGTLALILLLQHRSGADPRRAVLWAWCPLVVLELGNNAHVDGLAVLLSIAALGVLSRPLLPRPIAIAGGALLGLAVAVKYWPAALVPAGLRRHPVHVVFGAVAAAALVYVPFVPGAGWGVTGYLSEYVGEEGGGGLGVIRLLIPSPAAAVVGGLVLAITAVWASLRTDPRAPWAAGAVLIGVSLIVVTPTYQWYALMMPALVALGARASWLVLPPVMTFCYLFPGVRTSWAVDLSAEEVRAWLYLACAVVIAAAALVARRSGGSHVPVPSPDPERVAV